MLVCVFCTEGCAGCRWDITVHANQAEHTRRSPDQLLITTTASYIRVSPQQSQHTHANTETCTHVDTHLGLTLPGWNAALTFIKMRVMDHCSEQANFSCIWMNCSKAFPLQDNDAARRTKILISSTVCGHKKTALWGFSQCLPLSLSHHCLQALAPTVFAVGPACHRPQLRNDTQRQGANLQTVHSFSKWGWINSPQGLTEVRI